AADSIEALDSWGEKIVSLTTAPWLQAICIVALAIEGGSIVWAGKQGEQGIIKRVMPWMIGTIILLTASGITQFFFGNN
ncbi:MAG TPA: hypothetical protein DDW88_10980, partial [Treponema sp.]|nr:hypothetical protein [Treponema sp.]